MKKVLMLIANGVEPLEMAAFTDVLGWASLIGEQGIELVDVGLRQDIKTSFGLRLQPNHLLENLDLSEFDALAIPGGFETSGFYDEALSQPFLNVIGEFNKQNKLIASVCVASLALGQAGVLQGKKATTYHQVGGKRKQQLEQTGAVFVDQPIVCDSNFITSSGPGTATEVAFTLLEKLTSKENADQVRDKMRMPLPSNSWYNKAQVKV